jgi:UPF0755 protein
VKRAFAMALGLVVIFGCGAFAGYQWVERELDMPLSVPADATFIVPPGQNLRSIAQTLKQRGWVKHPQLLAGWGRWTGQAQKIKAGEFRVPVGTTPRTLLGVFVRGAIIQHEITLVEGWTFKQTVAAVRAHPVMTTTPALASPPASLAEIGLRPIHPEGRLLPDTYFFVRGTTDVELIERAFRAMESYLEQAWAKRAPNLPLKTPDEALTLASIVEKETGLASERATIAGVFTRRLNRGMRLETDPTVIYGIGDKFDGNITRRHLRQPTPYNTYVIKGLPPTPIAMPGREAIQAALHPSEGNALFFVARGNGAHYFSATYREHKAAVNKYQRKRKRTKRAN